MNPDLTVALPPTGIYAPLSLPVITNSQLLPSVVVDALPTTFSEAPAGAPAISSGHVVKDCSSTGSVKAIITVSCSDSWPGFSRMVTLSSCGAIPSEILTFSSVVTPLFVRITTASPPGAAVVATPRLASSGIVTSESPVTGCGTSIVAVSAMPSMIIFIFVNEYVSSSTLLK